MSSLSEFRNEMSVVDKYIYLNHAAIGPNPKSTTHLMEEIIASKTYGVAELDFEPISSQFKSTRSEIGKLINASENEIALTISTAHGISHLLSSMDWSDHRHKGIIINNLEFTSNSFPYQQIARKFRVPLYVVKTTDVDNVETVTVDDYKRIIEMSNVNLIGISHVQFLNGLRIDLKKLTKMAHEYQVSVLVDGIQSVGAMNVDVKGMNIDFLSAGGFKWLLGPMETGFIYVKKELLDSLNPLFVGPPSEVQPPNFRHHTFHTQETALKFHHSLLPYSAGLGESVKLLNKVGITTIEDQIKSLVEYTKDTFLAKFPGSRCISPIGDRGSGIVTFKLSQDITDANFEHNLVNEHKLSISIRGGGIRFSPHAYNTQEDIDQSVNILKGIL